MICRVSKRFPCQVCGKTDYCGVSDDGRIAICMRVVSGKRTKNNGNLHDLNNEIPPALIKQITTIAAERSAIEQRDAIYSKLISGHLVLSLKHRNDLLERGLTSQAINRNGYKSVPDTVYAKNIARSLSVDGLEGVPGFYFDKQWMMVARSPGFYIPIRDTRSRIQALQIRQDTGDPRYVWLSSAYQSKGSSSGAPVHFQNVHLIRERAEAIITEGALKADVIAHLQHTGTIGIAGVNTYPQDFAQTLKRELPELKSLIVAFDADWRTNPQVKSALLKLTQHLGKQFKVTVRTWWNGAKGYDDYLKTAKTPTKSYRTFCPVGCPDSYPLPQGEA